MDNLTYFQTTFEKESYANTKINYREFEDCTFKNCDFSSSDLSSSIFMDCEFVECNLSMVQLSNSSLKTVRFKNCKLLGIPFYTCDDFLFQVHFQECTLDYASFSNKKMPKTHFISCSLKEVSFTGTHLMNAVFENCNLERALFNDTILAGADFTSAYNYSIDPEFNLMKKAKFSIIGLPGLLDKYDIKIE